MLLILLLLRERTLIPFLQKLVNVLGFVFFYFKPALATPQFGLMFQPELWALLELRHQMLLSPMSAMAGIVARLLLPR